MQFTDRCAPLTSQNTADICTLATNSYHGFLSVYVMWRSYRYLVCALGNWTMGVILIYFLHWALAERMQSHIKCSLSNMLHTIPQTHWGTRRSCSVHLAFAVFDGKSFRRSICELHLKEPLELDSLCVALWRNWPSNAELRHSKCLTFHSLCPRDYLHLIAMCNVQTQIHMMCSVTTGCMLQKSRSELCWQH